MEYRACTSILVGKSASLDHSIMIGRNEDSKAAWPKHFVVHPRISREASTPEVFSSKDNGFSLELPDQQAKYTATPEWTDEFGLFEEAGINEFNVAMSATESAYANSRVLAYDPYLPSGIAEAAMVTVVLPYVKTAREGVLRLGQIIETAGTAESNGILFADQTECWYFESGSGHHWVAQRIPDGAYAIVANQLAIQKIDFSDEKQFLTSTGLRDFAQANRLWEPGTPFNWRQIFGTHDHSDLIYNTPRVWSGQKLLSPSQKQEPQSDELPFIQYPDQPIQLEQVAAILGSHFEGTVYDPVGLGTAAEKHAFRPISLAKTQESHILQIRTDLPAAFAARQWLAMGVTAESLFVPFYANIDDTPADYQNGGVTYTPDSAYWLYKQVGVLLDSHFQHFLPLLQTTQTQTHAKLLRELAKTDQQAQQLTGQALTHYLTKASANCATIGRTAFTKLAADLITQLTDLSPLNFSTDANL